MQKATLAFVADLHVGDHRRWGVPSRGHIAPMNSRAVAIVEILKEARRQAEKAGATDFFVLGDVFDTSAPTPQHVAEVQHALRSTTMTAHVLVGNHDQVSDQRGDHALISMDGWHNIRVYERPDVLYLDGWQVHLVPYRPGRADEYLLPALDELVSTADPLRAGEERVLCLHLGLRGEQTPKWLSNSHDSIDAKAIPRDVYAYTLAGNWHGRAVVLKNVIQVGALVPTGFDNPGLTGYGSLVLLDGGGPKAAELDGPRFVRAAGLGELKAALEAISARTTAWKTYLSIRCTPDEKAEARELCELYGHEDFEVLSDKEAAEAAARDAASATAYVSADGVQAAVTAYVQAMALPPDVDRQQVTGMALGYLAGVA
jgi:hypothetical protein